MGNTKKDILFLCQFFYPEYNSSATLPFDTAKYLASHGFTVDGLVGYPKEYSVDKHLSLEETVEGVGIKRIKYMQLALTVPKVGYDQFAHLMLNNVMLINKHFNARDVIKNNAMNWLSPFRVGFKSAVLNIIPFLLGYYPGFSNPHLPSPFLKMVYGELWQIPMYAGKLR